MSSRFSAARPKRTGEVFARAHHGEHHPRDGASPSVKKVKFDVRNPSALAPESRGDDDDYDETDDHVLAADVIRSTAGATKRGAVNIDGYDSDSDNETFEARAEARERGKKGKDVDIADELDLDKYNAKLAPGAANGADDDDEDDEIDMFGAADNDAEETDAAGNAAGRGKAGRKNKEVRFLENENIEGQVKTSKSGGTVRLDDEDVSSDDEEEIALAVQEEGIDEEIGLGGLKRNAPKVDAFNMRQEQEEGAFDEAGNYIRGAVDPDAVHDRWLEGVNKKEMKKAAEAHVKREAELRQQRREDDSILTADLFGSLILRLETAETPLEALARLGKLKTNKAKAKVPKWKQKKQKNGPDRMDVDTKTQPEDPKQVKVKEAIDAITEAADRLLRRDYPDIYDTEREKLIREYLNETGEQWVDPPEQAGEDADAQGGAPSTKMWNYRWTDGRDGGVGQGPYDGPTMKAWQDAGYFGEGVEFRPAGEEGEWTGVASFV